MQTFFKVVGAVALLAVLAYGGFSLDQKYIKHQANVGADIFLTTTIPTNSSSTISTTTGGTAAIATSTSRGYLYIANDSQNVVYLAIGAPAVVGKGFRIQASSTLEFKPPFMFTGAIYAISTATSNITWVESTK